MACFETPPCVPSTAAQEDRASAALPARGVINGSHVGWYQYCFTCISFVIRGDIRFFRKKDKTAELRCVCFFFCCSMRLQFSSVQSLNCVRFFATPWTAARQASLPITNSRSLFKFISIELVKTSNHLILCCPLLLPPSIFPSIRVFSSELGGILVPRPGLEPTPSAVKLPTPNHWTAREFPLQNFK